MGSGGLVRRAARLPARGWIAAGRTRRRLARRRVVAGAGSEVRLWMAEHVAGRSFADVGCMWGIHGEYAFLAEELGATTVTGIDGMAPTPEFIAAHARRESGVRFVQGDFHDPATVEEVGVHDVVFCSGVIYHSPHPVQLLAHLRRITGEWLLLVSHAIPEVPGLDQACIFYPGMDAIGRAVYAQAHHGRRMPGVTEPFDGSRHNAYANMWWGITPSALTAMLQVVGFEVQEHLRNVDAPFNLVVLARTVTVEESIPPPEINRVHAAEARSRGEIPEFPGATAVDPTSPA
jgi:SAM-dependent methyltransferase